MPGRRADDLRSAQASAGARTALITSPPSASTPRPTRSAFRSRGGRSRRRRLRSLPRGTPWSAACVHRSVTFVYPPPTTLAWWHVVASTVGPSDLRTHQQRRFTPHRTLSPHFTSLHASTVLPGQLFIRLRALDPSADPSSRVWPEPPSRRMKVKAASSAARVIGVALIAAMLAASILSQAQPVFATQYAFSRRAWQAEAGEVA